MTSGRAFDKPTGVRIRLMEFWVPQSAVAFDKLTDTDKKKLAVCLSCTSGRAGGDTMRGAIALLRRDLAEPTSDPKYRGFRSRVLKLIDSGDDGLFGYVCRYVDHVYGGIMIW